MQTESVSFILSPSKCCSALSPGTARMVCPEFNRLCHLHLRPRKQHQARLIRRWIHRRTSEGDSRCERGWDLYSTMDSLIASLAYLMDSFVRQLAIYCYI